MRGRAPASRPHRVRVSGSSPQMPTVPWLPDTATACPSSSSDDLGVAVCLLGFVRTLGQQPVYESISAHFRSHGHADIFGVVSSRGDDTAKGQWDDVKPQDLEAALQTLRPVAWEDTNDARGPRCGLLCLSLIHI